MYLLESGALKITILSSRQSDVIKRYVTKQTRTMTAMKLLNQN